MIERCCSARKCESTFFIFLLSSLVIPNPRHLTLRSMRSDVRDAEILLFQKSSFSNRIHSKSRRRGLNAGIVVVKSRSVLVEKLVKIMKNACFVIIFVIRNTSSGKFFSFLKNDRYCCDSGPQMHKYSYCKIRSRAITLAVVN